jgi:thiamine biosynthesis protein ThiS
VIEIRVNGEERQTSASTVSGLLSELGVVASVIIVEKNGAILVRDLLSSETIKEGDRFELIGLMGGG